MLPNFLHIWPRDEFMMIALPNQDHTFTGTLFLPFPIFEKVQERGEDGVMEFFTTYFPDAIPLIGEESLKNTFTSTKALPMVSVKVLMWIYTCRILTHETLSSTTKINVDFFFFSQNFGSKVGLGT